MRIQVVFHASLRNLLPEEAKGRTALEVRAGSRVSDLMQALAVPSSVICAVNGRTEPDRNRVLADGDEVRFLRPSGGG